MFRASILVASLMFAAPAFAQVTVQYPKAQATLAQSFTIYGEATGVDIVHVWGFPSTGPVWLGQATPVYPVNGPNSIGRYELITDALAAPVGTYPVVVYGHDAAHNNFPYQAQVTVTVTMGPNISQGFGAGAFVNSTALDDAFTIYPGGTYSGGEIAFGRRWPSPPSCVAQSPTVALSVDATRTHATISVTGTPNLAPIQVLCGGGR